MVKTKTFSVIVKILIHNRGLVLNFVYKTYYPLVINLGNHPFFFLGHHKGLLVQFIKSIKKEVIFLDSLFFVFNYDNQFHFFILNVDNN